MNKIKDFFYNKNDIIIVLIILVAAAFIIYVRIGDIMDYPETYAKQAASSQQSTVLEETASSDTESVSKTTEQSTDKTASSEKNENTKSDSSYITLVIKDTDTSASVAKKLYKAGLVQSADKFESYINKKGKSESIKSGKFKIPENSSDKEILDIISN